MTPKLKICAEALTTNARGEYIVGVPGIRMTLLQGGAVAEPVQPTNASGVYQFATSVTAGSMGGYTVQADLGTAKYEFRGLPAQDAERSSLFKATGRAYVHKVTFYLDPKAWIAFRIANEAGAILTGIQISIKRPDNSRVSKMLAQADMQPDGSYKLEKIPAGNYEFCLTDLDQDLWKAGGAPANPVSYQDFRRIQTQGRHLAQAGDCVWSLAVAHGVTEDLIWNDPQNAALAQKYKNKYTLLPGERVDIPLPRRKRLSLADSAIYDFVVMDQPREMVVKLMDRGRPAVAGIAGAVKIAGKPDLPVTTDGDGATRFRVPFGATQATLEFPTFGIKTYQLMLGQLAPIESAQGVSQRLANLGYFVDPGAADPQRNDRFTTAVKHFQKSNGVAPASPNPDGTVNQQTMDALVRVCGA